jgi:ribosome maturation factor RimP
MGLMGGGRRAVIAPSLAATGYEVVRVLLMGQHRPLLQIMIERADRLCLGRRLRGSEPTVSALLDVEELIAGSYTLEVSSPESTGH